MWNENTDKKSLICKRTNLRRNLSRKYVIRISRTCASEKKKDTVPNNLETSYKSIFIPNHVSYKKQTLTEGTVDFSELSPTVWPWVYMTPLHDINVCVARTVSNKDTIYIQCA